MSDGTGGTWWRPARLSDIYDLPDRVLTLFRYYRMGQLAREHPYDWWRPEGSREFAHHYPASFAGYPVDPARCLHPAPDVAMERTGGKHPCPRCRAIAEPPTEQGAPGAMRFVASPEERP